MFAQSKDEFYYSFRHSMILCTTGSFQSCQIVKKNNHYLLNYVEIIFRVLYKCRLFFHRNDLNNKFLVGLMHSFSLCMYHFSYLKSLNERKNNSNGL